MPSLKLTVLSLRYSSWSMRPWVALTHAGANFSRKTVELVHMQQEADYSQGTIDVTNIEPTPLADRRELGSVHGLFPVLRVDGVPIHESLAICEYVADAYPAAGLWPDDAVNRAQARAVSCEMVSGFADMRGELASHLFARVPDFEPSADAWSDISRVFEIWSECLERSGGPFLFGRFSVADAMYFPVLTRFNTYGIPLPETLSDYARAVDSLPAVRKLFDLAASEPRTPVYDEYIRALGGDPDAALPAI
jgi:glutathione S-transferase